jgi:hypothetical protein
MAETTEEFFGVLRNASSVFTTGTKLTRDEFNDLAKQYVRATYGIQMSKTQVQGRGRARTVNTSEGRLVEAIVNQWPEDLLVEELIYSTNWANAAAVVSNSSGEFKSEVETFTEKWMQIEGEGVRGFVENLAESYGWDETLRQRTVDVYQEVMVNEPLTLGILTGRGTEGTPANNWLNTYMANIETKAADFARTGGRPADSWFSTVVSNVRAEIANQAQTGGTPPTEEGTPVTTTTTPPTAPPTTSPPTSGSSSSTTAPPSGTTLPPRPGGGGPVGAMDGSVSGFTNVQAFFDQYPGYDFMSSLGAQGGLAGTPYQYFDEFTSRYGTFTSPSGETWNAVDAMNWLDVLYRGNKANFTKLQDDLRQAGYFDQGLPKKGYLDDTTWAAWATFLGDAARNNRTPLEHFADAKTSFRQGLWDEQVQTNDLATLQGTVRDAGMQLIGRALREDEFETLLSAIRQWEVDYVKGQTFALGQPEQVDLNARIEQYITRTNETEYASANTFNSLNLMKQVLGE